MPGKVAVIGLGLIGGSLCRAMRASGFADTVVGYDRDAGIGELAVDLEVVDRFESTLEQALSGAELVVIATPTLAAAEVLADVLVKLPAEAVLTDVASVKGNLVAAYQHTRETILADDTLSIPGVAPFVPGHPIAGSERSGVDASRPELFKAHRVILTPLEDGDADALALVRRLWESAGAEVVEMPVEQHDAILAATSHLPHILAFALVDALSRSDLSDDIFRFAAGGFRDFTRIASSNPVMWRDIALANREPLVQAIDEFGEHLKALRDAVADGDGAALENTFADARSAREHFIKQQAP
ncbi:MAG: prephenate dehydrogenase/arogenate dehydrogenase family protein [Halieaceae bacterium]|jgi:prephenate dehydrogenase|nr:prephenate dehydrogenase/arogenate dehydrogenase family protein [Halieaceae bacterium]